MLVQIVDIITTIGVVTTPLLVAVGIRAPPVRTVVSTALTVLSLVPPGGDGTAGRLPCLPLPPPPPLPPLGLPPAPVLLALPPAPMPVLLATPTAPLLPTPTVTAVYESATKAIPGKRRARSLTTRGRPADERVSRSRLLRRRAPTRQHYRRPQHDDLGVLLGPDHLRNPSRRRQACLAARGQTPSRARPPGSTPGDSDRAQRRCCGTRPFSRSRRSTDDGQR